MSDEFHENNLPSPDQIWNALKPAERLKGCEDFWIHGQQADLARVTIVLAQEMRFRQKAISSMTVAEKGKHFGRYIDHRRLRQHREDVIQAWLLEEYRPLISAFVEQLGTPHKEGLIDGDHEQPTAEKFQKGIRALQPFAPRVAAIYLGYLLVFGDEFWSELQSAVIAEKWDLNSMLAGEYPEAFGNHGDSALGSPEDNETFTTLDNSMIVAAVASAFGQTGALKPEQVVDLVEEVVELNSTRHHSLFHRGFIDALFQKEFRFHFPGENEERRLWYACGAIFGLLRRDDTQQILRILVENEDLAVGLANRKNIRCGAKLLPHLFGPLFDAGRLSLLTEWMVAQLPRLEASQGFRLLQNAHYQGARLLRAGNAAEADMLFEVVETQLAELDEKDVDEEDVDEKVAAIQDLSGANQRKRSQVLQLQGDFANATNRLEKLLESDGVNNLDLANATADLGLIGGGFRSIAAILPSSSDRQQVASMATALEKGRPYFERAIEQFGKDAANAHFCIGILKFLTESVNPLVVADHWRQSLAGMLRRQFAYESSGMIDWGRFCLGISLLESLEISEYQHASEGLTQALEAPTKFPIWLWGRALQAAAEFDDRSLLEKTAAKLLETRAEEALSLLLDSGAAEQNAMLRDDVLKRIGETNLPIRTRWDRLIKLLSGALRDRLDQAEEILDQLEGMAVECAELRPFFVQLLSKSESYSPAWDPTDAEQSLVRVHLLEGAFDSAKEIMLRRFYRLREGGQEYQRAEGLEILAELREFPGGKLKEIHEIENSWPAEVGLNRESVTIIEGLRQGAKVRIFYVGGNETQRRYVGDLQRMITDEFPGVEVDFDLPGWSSSWNVDCDRVKAKIPKYDVLVLSNLVRTQFGRQVRKACGPNCPWVSSTGKGKDSIGRSIRNAAIFAEERLHGNRGKERRAS